jgi:hypothetical protein
LLIRKAKAKLKASQANEGRDFGKSDRPKTPAADRWVCPEPPINDNPILKEIFGKPKARPKAKRKRRKQ